MAANHFLVFVCYCGKIEDIEVLPEVWVMPSTKLMEFVYTAPGGRKLVQRAKLLKHGQAYRNAWSLIVGHP